MFKTIWIINQTAGSLESGWGERHYFLAKHWVQKGYRVKIISGAYNHLFLEQPKTQKKRFTIEKTAHNIEFCWVKVYKYKNTGFSKMISNLSFTMKLFFLSTKILEKPDIILVSSMPIFPILNGTFFKKKYKAKKLIIEIRDLWPLTPIYLKGYSKSHPLIKILGWFEKYAYKKSDTIVSVLPNAEKYITSISNDSSKFKYIPNGLDENSVKNEEIPKSIIKLIPKNKFIVGYAGTIGLANAMEYFVEAALLTRNENIHFILVGDGHQKYQLKQRANNASNITFIDKIKKNQVQSILSYFNVCYLSRYKSPLYTHGVSYNKYFDYMLAKKPILESSDYIKDQVELSGCGIIVTPENVFALLEGIETLYNKSEIELKEMGEKGYYFVKEYHNFAYLSKKYLKLF